MIEVFTLRTYDPWKHRVGRRCLSRVLPALGPALSVMTALPIGGPVSSCAGPVLGRQC
jgi:hypothetical protein